MKGSFIFSGRLSSVLSSGLLCVAAFASIAGAQTNRQQKQAAPIGVTPPAAGQLKAAEPSIKFQSLKPKDLDQTAKLNRVKELTSKSSDAPKVAGFGTSVKITPRDGFLDGKAKLWFASGVVAVNYESAHAVIGSIKDFGVSNPVNCEFKPSAPGRYLVDIAVHSAFNESLTYTVKAEGNYGQNHVNLTLGVPDSLGHLTFLYDIKDTNWSSVTIYADKQWVFYSCEMSLIK